MTVFLDILPSFFTITTILPCIKLQSITSPASTPVVQHPPTQKLLGFRETSGQGKVVCVTGASGYIASWLVKLLLQRGYSVHATVRSIDDPKKTEHLRALDGANERLSLFEANLTEEGSFDSAINGCECVFHTASPVIFSASNPRTQLREPAVKGTLNVLKSAAKVQSLKRVVLTSSIAAVMFPAKPPEFGDVMDETWYSDPEICKQENILAEDAAVKFCKDNGLELVVTNPGYVIGPILQPTLNVTSEGIIGMIESDGNDGEAVPNNVSRARVESLGIAFTPVEVTIKDTVESLKEKNFLSF